MKEKELISDIEYLESNETLRYIQHHYLTKKDIRKIKLEGERVRSRLQWLKEGEKPTKFISSIENKKIVEKNMQLNTWNYKMDIRKIKLEGERVRSRLQWLKEGEKPTKFISSIENKKIVEKNMQLNTWNYKMGSL